MRRQYLSILTYQACSDEKDQIMAKHWLMEAEKIDANSPNVKQCRELLFQQ